VALVDADDQYHEQCVPTLKSVHEPLATVWPPLTEAMYLLNDLPAAQEALWEMLVRKALELLPLALVDLPRIRELLLPIARWILPTQRLSGLPSEKVFAKYLPWTRETSLFTEFMVGSVPQSSHNSSTW
jgi:hypothetical protein